MAIAELVIAKKAIDGAKAVGRTAKKYAPQLLSALVCGAIVWASYLWGKYDADIRWIAANNKSIEGYNTKITKLESDSNAAAERLRLRGETLQAQLNSISKNTPIIYVHDAKGNEVRCSASAGSTVTTPVQAYLGESFKDAWNKLNAKTEE